ncbi:TraR/DksA family transcriptional regulator [Kytococcus schroeteri]|uniref:TraR/DksA family transcriptional regulator n=1 Tax=Kytococcus schroeteri TaxID=138300 RepID=UPI001EE0284D|nr:TraR/DksA C4-type zinc finger protein [Kytococcus schroeteri]
MATTTASTKTPTKKATAKKATAKKAGAKATKDPAAAKAEGASKKATAKKATATKAAGKKAAGKKSTAKADAKKAAKKAAEKKSPATKATAKKTTAKKAPAKKSTVGERLTGRKAAKAKELVVGQAEEPWSKAELAEVRTELESELARLTQELEIAESDLYELVSSSQGSQGDEADAGSFSSERQHEMSLAENSRSMLLQTTTALGRIADGTYGRCENCDQAIGKMRLQAFPRATLCMPCKQHQERR